LFHREESLDITLLVDSKLLQLLRLRATKTGQLSCLISQDSNPNEQLDVFCFIV